MEQQESYRIKINYRIHIWSEERFYTYIKEILSDGYEHIHQINLEQGHVKYLVPEKIFKLLRQNN